MIERTRIEGVADAKQRNEIPTPPLKSLNSLAADAVDAADAKIGTFCTGEKRKHLRLVRAQIAAPSCRASSRPRASGRACHF